MPTHIILGCGFSRYLQQPQKQPERGLKTRKFCKKADNFHAWIVHSKEGERRKFPVYCGLSNTMNHHFAVISQAYILAQIQHNFFFFKKKMISAQQCTCNTFHCNLHSTWSPAFLSDGVKFKLNIF